MITFITGLPGNGKTLYALQYVAAMAKKEGRQVFYHGIRGLTPKLGWLELTTKDEHINGDKNPPIQVPQWWTVPVKAIVLIDEAQMCGFGVRPRGQVPEWGQRLETHRHAGLDLVLITQDPGLIDSHDRKLAELHFHVMRSFGMQRAVIHEFRPVRQNVLTSRAGSIQHQWSYPKEVFTWYESAEAHTHRRRVPAKLWIFAALPFLIGALSWFIWAHMLDPHRRDAEPSKLTTQVNPPPPTLGGQGGPSGGLGAGQKLTAAEYVQQFAPRVAGLDYTAPAYDEVTKPVQAPFPAACVESSTVCRCYTSQGTRLVTPLELCKGIVAGGFFVAWDKPVANAVPIQQPAAAPTPVSYPAAASFGGIERRLVADQPSASILDDRPLPPPGRGKNLPPAGS